MESKRIIFVGVGGQGNLLATMVLAEAALSAGFPVNVSEVHGMAQRGGVVESAAIIGEAKSSIISNGEADGLIGLEPSEAIRAVGKCNAGSVVITNTAPLPPFTVAIGKGVYPDIPKVLELLKSKVRRVIAFDANALAKAAGSSMTMNIVMLGALAESNILPFGVETFKKVIQEKTKKKFVDMNLKAFDLGFEAARQQA
jgi:indolepyruvate ferredoxin oxidoreductase beta subunit